MREINVKLSVTAVARGILSGLHSRLGQNGAVTLDFDGHNVTFVEWTKGGLYDSATGLYSMIILVPRIGNFNAWELQFKDMNKGIGGLELDYKKWMVTDGGRWLHYSQQDHTCYQRHLELQYRLCGRARWTALKVENISCATDAFGNLSSDPASEDFLGRGYTTFNYDVADTFIPFTLRSA